MDFLRSPSACVEFHFVLIFNPTLLRLRDTFCLDKFVHTVLRSHDSKWIPGMHQNLMVFIVGVIKVDIWTVVDGFSDYS